MNTKLTGSMKARGLIVIREKLDKLVADGHLTLSELLLLGELTYAAMNEEEKQFEDLLLHPK